MSSINVHYKLVINHAEGDDGIGVVFIDHEMVGRFAWAAPEANLPRTAADAINLCSVYARNMQNGVLSKILPKKDLDRYGRKADEHAELARKIRSGKVKTTYALSVERYLIREFCPEDYDELSSTVEAGT